MRPGFVVGAPPGVQHEPGVWQRSEQRLVQQFVAQATVEALAEAVLLWLARRDAVPTNPGLVGSADDRVGSSAPKHDGVQLSRHPPT